jgi:hypothetical protein
MEIGVLMGLLSLGLLFSLGGSDDDTPDETPLTDEPETDATPEEQVLTPLTDEPAADVPPEGQVLEYDGSIILDGTAGDDAVLNEQDQTLAPSTINLGDGDDSAVINTYAANGGGISINGEGGNDLIEVGTETEIVTARINGGEGDDTIVAGEGNTLWGGEGNDNITVNIEGGFDGLGSADGGLGDDTINGTSVYGERYLISSAVLAGGEGNDTFNLELNPSENFREFDLAEILEGGGVLEVAPA